MSRLQIKAPAQAQKIADGLRLDLERRVAAGPMGLCPVDLTLGYLTLCLAQSCGKCVPCRVGLAQIAALMRQILDGTADVSAVDLIEKTAAMVVDSADCAIGTEAARMVLTSVRNFKDDYIAHATAGGCSAHRDDAVPCVAGCPANVDIPGYIALVRAGRCADALQLIRKDNPFPGSCGYICEHPCEMHCRRNLIDAAVNIRAIKRYASDTAYDPPLPSNAESSGKTVAVIGGGPAGLTAAYYLTRMGHSVTLFEKRPKLGGMLRYGIPSYRLPRSVLDREISYICNTGVTVKVGTDIGNDIGYDALREQFDAVYVAIGAHADKKIGIEGEDSDGVISAIALLGSIGAGELPDYSGKNVVVVGGGNVAMDCVRSTIRLGAKSVTCVYRRRKEDMTALPEEVEAAEREGGRLVCLEAPVRIEADKDGHCAALWTQPQIIGPVGADGRPKPIKRADCDENRIPADIIIAAVGQGIDCHGLSVDMIGLRGSVLAGADGSVRSADGVFAGGDCVTGPATVIRAIAAGKTAAANIDEYLGFHHVISTDIHVPAPVLEDKAPHGRVNPVERPATESVCSFDCVEYTMTDQEAQTEASRCLRCDCCGYGNFRGGRSEQW